MIQSVGRALRQAAGGSIIFVLGIGAVGSQPQATAATAASAAGPAMTSSSSAAAFRSIVAPALDEHTPSHEERATAHALQAVARAAAATIVATRPVSHPAAVSKTRRSPAVAVAAALPAPAPPAVDAAAGAIVAPAGNSAGYSFGYCTWWVSHKRLIPWHASAYQWWSMARAYGFAEGSIPRPGAVMVMGAGMAGASASSGHVAYVESVNANGSFVISEMNWWGVAGGGWGKVDYRTITSLAGTLGFIY